MKTYPVKLAILAAALVSFSGVVFPHHGTAAYEVGQTVTLKGKATDFQFRNPEDSRLFDDYMKKTVAGENK